MPDGTSTSILIILDVGDAPDADPLDDFVGVYYTLLDAGARLLIASEAGGYPWAQRPKRAEGMEGGLVGRFLSDRQARDEAADTLRTRDVFVEDFEACVVVGSASPVWESDGSDAHALVGGFLKAGKPVATVSGRNGFMPAGRTGGLALLSKGGKSLPAAIRALLAALLSDDGIGDPR
jgi:putative intracellular protease/amidase